MKMYKIPKMLETQLEVNTAKDGESIEQKIERMLNNKEKMKGDGAPLLYTERKEGVRASTNIRTDRFAVAVEAADKIAKSRKARRENKPVIGSRDPKDVKDESIQGKSDTDTNKAK